MSPAGYDQQEATTGEGRSLYLGSTRIEHAIVNVEYGDPTDPEGRRLLPPVPMCWQHGPECPLSDYAKRLATDLCPSCKGNGLNVQMGDATMPTGSCSTCHGTGEWP